MNCVLCTDKTNAIAVDLCSLHARSLENLKIAHKEWDSAYGGLSLDEFLKRIAGLPGTGKAAKEVARYLRENPSRWK